MRQGNGSEILGANDPRSANIGIIYVAPMDDRESVLAAILTQERLGRKEVAVVLPEQNRAFQHPVDFDGLKNMRRKMQAQIVFVAPAGPGPAEFARQRRFPVYSSLEYFANSLREDDAQNQVGKNGKSGGLFGRRQKPAVIVLPVPAQSAPVRPLSKTVLDPLDDEIVPVSDEALYSSAGAGNAMDSPPLNHDAMVMPAAVDSGTLVDADGEEDDLDVPLPPIIPLFVPGVDAVAASNAAAQSNGAGVGHDAGLANAGSSAGPNIIELSPRRTGNTGKMTAIPSAQPDPQPINLSTKPRSNTGKMAAIGAAGVVGAAGAAGMGAGPGMTTMAMAQTARGSGGSGVPPRSGTGGSGSSGGPARRNAVPRWLIAAALVILTLLLVFGGIAYAAPSVFKNFTNIVPGVSLSSSATVTITPTSKNIKNTYVITAVTGTPSASQRQVQARILTYTTPSQSKTVNATGIKKTPGARASGTLTFFNGSTSAFTVAAGTLFVTGSGVQLVNDVQANIPAANPPNEGSVTVSAHAVNVGSSGNIPALAINATCCATGNFILVKNLNAFTGGQDPQNYTFVQQSDIDGAANPLEQQLMTTALNNVKGQKRTGELYINASNPVQCTPNVSANHQAGDKASSVTVTVTATCSGEVYNQQAAETMAAGLYKSDSTINPGPGFALTGNVTTNLTQATVLDSRGTVSLLVQAQGTWVYQITSTQEKAGAQQIKGKSTHDAQTFLLGQTGVSHVAIQLSSGNTLPTDPNQIKFVIQNVPTGSGSPTPVSSPIPGSTPSSGTPTPVPGLGGS